jgi:hypothetical protein
MSNEQWQSCTDPMVLLERLQGIATDRKLRLFAVACSRRIWQYLDELARGAVIVAEQYADGCATAQDLRAARLACQTAGGNASWYSAASDPAIAARNAALSAQTGMNSASERMAQVELLRDIFADSFGSIPSIDPNWRSAAVFTLAHDIYQGCTFNRMLELAHALIDAGCNEDPIVEHCLRNEGHVRGCWVLDLILERH